MNRIIFNLVLVSFVTISGHNQAPADAYQQLYRQLEIAHEDLISVLQSKDAIIKAQLIEIIHLKKQIKERSKQNGIEEK